MIIAMGRHEDLILELEAMAQPSQIEKVARFFKGDDRETRIIGIPIGRIFPVAKRHTALDLADVERLLDDARYEVRMAAMAILDFKAQRKDISKRERTALFELYLRKHDRINNWDLVDRAAARVVGDHLVDKDRSVLDRLAASKNPHERRTALVATHAFLKKGDVSDTFRIAGILADDADAYVQKAIGSWTREAGKTDERALIGFLEKYGDRLPKPTITAASKRLPDSVRRRLKS